MAEGAFRVFGDTAADDVGIEADRPHGQAARILVDEIPGRLHRSYVHCVLVDVLNGFADTLRSFEISTILWSMQTLHDFCRKDCFDRLLAYPGKYVNLQVANNLLYVVL